MYGRQCGHIERTGYIGLLGRILIKPFKYLLMTHNEKVLFAEDIVKLLSKYGIDGLAGYYSSDSPFTMVVCMPGKTGAESDCLFIGDCIEGILSGLGSSVSQETKVSIYTDEMPH